MTSGTACDNRRTDHREMEVYLDRLLAALQCLGPEPIAEAQASVLDIRRLSAIHFEKEEVIFYPSSRPAFPDLLAQMDRQHDEVREVEQHVEELLSDPPGAPESRWLNDVRLEELAKHILATHHEYLKLELPALVNRMNKVFSVHGDKDPRP
jgi:hypothetical protein